MQGAGVYPLDGSAPRFLGVPEPGSHNPKLPGSYSIRLLRGRIRRSRGLWGKKTAMAMNSVRKCKGFVSVAAVLLVACGGEETPAPSPAEESPSPAAAAEAIPPPPPVPTDINVEERDSDGNPVRFSGTDGSGNAFEASFGDDAKVPSNFPEDVPIFPSATPMAAMVSEREGVMVTFKSTEKQQKIYEFYRSKLSEQGWSIDSKASFGGQLGLEAEKSKRKVTLRISGTTGDSYISLMVTEAS